MARHAKVLIAASLLALGALAQAQPAPSGITSTPVPAASMIDPAAAPVISRWTRGNLKPTDSRQTLADLRRDFPGLTLFRRANGLFDRNRAMFVPSAVRIDGRAYHLSYLRQPDGNNTAHLVTWFPVSKIKACETAFHDQLDTVADTLEFAPTDWRAERGAAITAQSPFAVQASWRGSPGILDQFDRAIYDPAWPPLAKHFSPSGAGYATLPVSYPEKLRPFAAYRRDASGKNIAVAVAQVIQEAATNALTCRLGLVRQGPGPQAPAAPSSYALPVGAVLTRADLQTSGTLASRYARLSPAKFGVAERGTLPEQPVDFTCKLSSDSGALIGCFSDGARPDPANQATWVERHGDAATILNAHMLTAWQYDEDFLADLPVRVRFAANLDDLPPAIDWDSEPLGSPRMLEFDRPLQINSFDYPSRALREEREAMVSMDCVILPDLSSFCGRYSIDPVDAAAAYAPVLRTIQRRNVVRKAKPLLANGKPAVGYRYRQRIHFQIPDN